MYKIVVFVTFLNVFLISVAAIDTGSIPKPHIETPNNETIKIGATCILNCTVTVEPNVYFKLNWITPNPAAERTRSISATRTNSILVDIVDKHKYGSSSLTIKDIQHQDAGEYTCVITDHTGQTNSASRNISISEPRTEYSPPVIKNGSTEMIVSAENNLTLLCEGKEEITWTPNNMGNDWSGSVVNVITSQSNGQYTAKLTLTNASFMDVGYYYCHAKNAAKDHPQRSDKIYVYVRDENHLSVEPNEEIVFLTALQQNTVILPCQPTSPDVTVSLYDINGGKEVQNSSFDKHIGYKVKTNLNNDYYKCKFQRNGKEEDLIVVVTVKAVTDSVTKPYIDAPSNGTAQVGSTYILTCIVTVPNVNFTLMWIIPNSAAKKTGRISAARSTVIDYYGSKYGSSLLTIKDIQHEDAGEYSCVFTDHTGKNNSYSRNISISY